MVFEDFLQDDENTEDQVLDINDISDIVTNNAPDIRVLSRTIVISSLPTKAFYLSHRIC